MDTVSEEKTAAQSTAADDLRQGVAFTDEGFVPIGRARIPILDWGFLRSDATYDVVHVWHGAFFRLEDHLDRFLRGVERLHMRLPLDRSALRDVLFECVRRAGLEDAYVEMICTRGIPAPGSRDPRQAENRFYAFAIPFVWIADPERQERGLHLTISSVTRIPPEAVDPTVKNYHWLDLVGGLLEALERGGETTVLLDAAGNVIEGPGFNIFALVDGRLVTPERGMLEGITRRTVMEIAEALGIACAARALPTEELRACEEAFVTSTAGGVMPVTRIDGQPVGDGRVGLVTRRIHTRYWDWHADPRFATPVGG